MSAFRRTDFTHTTCTPTACSPAMRRSAPTSAGPYVTFSRASLLVLNDTLLVELVMDPMAVVPKKNPICSAPRLARESGTPLGEHIWQAPLGGTTMPATLLAIGVPDAVGPTAIRSRIVVPPAVMLMPADDVTPAAERVPLKTAVDPVTGPSASASVTTSVPLQR